MYGTTELNNLRIIELVKLIIAREKKLRRDSVEDLGYIKMYAEANNIKDCGHNQPKGR